MCPSVKTSVCHQVTSPSVNPSVHHATNLSIIPSIHNMTSPSINISVIHVTCPSLSPPVHSMFSPSDYPSKCNHLCTILPSLADCPETSDCLPTIFTCPSDNLSLPNHQYDNYPSPSACLSPSDHLSATMIHLCACLSSHTTQCMHDSSQCLAVVNGEQSHKAKKFHLAFTNYDLLLHALDVSSISTSVSRHVAPPKSGDNAHITCGMCGSDGPTLYQPSLGFSYVLP